MNNTRREPKGGTGLQCLVAVAAVLLISGTAFAAVGVYTGVVGRIIGWSSLLVGHELNGTGLNGAVLDGQAVSAVFFDGASLDGEPLRSVSLSESELSGVDDSGRRLHKGRMLGVEFAGVLTDGAAVQLRIDGIRRGKERLVRDVTFYRVSVTTDDGRIPLCGTGEDGEPLEAIAMDGRWDMSQGTGTGGDHVDDPDSFTFACRDYVIAKCVENGYKPWLKAMACTVGEGCEKRDLAAHHQACTRMLRADYCGDGTAHTVDDTLVNPYDGYALHVDELDWPIEAEWNEHGAVCVARERIPGDAPACLQNLAADDCGDTAHFYDDTLIISEVEPR